MDQQSRGRKNFNGGGGGRGGDGGGGGGGGNGRSYYNNYQHYPRGGGNNGGNGRDYHSNHQQRGGNGHMTSSDFNNNNSFHFIGQQGYRASIGIWRNILRRQNELLNDKSKSMREIEMREMGLKQEFCRKEKIQRKQNQAKQQDEEKVQNETDGRDEEHAASCSKGATETGQEDKDDASVFTTATATTKQHRTRPESGKNKDNHNDFDSYDTDADEVRIEVNRMYQQKERKLEQDVARFFQDVERQMVLIDRRIFEPRMMENELLLRDQQISMFHQRVLSLEEKSRSLNDELEYYRHLVQELNETAALREQEFAAEKEVIMSKVKADTMTQLIRLSGNPNMWSDPFLATDPKLNLESDEYMNHHPLLSSPSFHAWVSESHSPCLQPMPTLNGHGILSDLRDRYEDVKCFGYIGRNENTEWILTMIRKIVMFYEAHNMRVYEEALQNQYVSTLIWCPNDTLCPQKSQSSFGLGYGPTQFEATANALLQAYTVILDMEKKLANPESSTEPKSDIPSPSQKTEEEESPSLSSNANESNETETDSTESDVIRDTIESSSIHTPAEQSTQIGQTCE